MDWSRKNEYRFAAFGYLFARDWLARLGEGEFRDLVRMGISDIADQSMKQFEQWLKEGRLEQYRK